MTRLKAEDEGDILSGKEVHARLVHVNELIDDPRAIALAILSWHRGNPNSPPCRPLFPDLRVLIPGAGVSFPCRPKITGTRGE
jgi:hypothetical protein